VFRKASVGVVLAGLLFTGAVAAAPLFVNGLAIPGDTGDQYGTEVNDGRLGFFSDLYYNSIRKEWWGLSDRGPGGGTLAYDTRVQRFTIDIDPITGAISNFQVAQTIKFTNGGPHRTMNGQAPNPNDVLGNSFDPEGLVISPKNGHFLVSDEYGPSLYEFNRNGEFVRAFATPANLIPRDAVTEVPNYAADPTTNPAGKRTNRGFEGLAVSPDGQYAYAMLQSTMLDEGGGNGTVNRIVKFDLDAGRAVAQYAYQMEGSSQGRGISALVALNDTEFLVLERNNRGVGVGADLSPPSKRVYKIDIDGAADISGIDLDSGAAYVPVTKNPTIFINLGVNTLLPLGNKVPEKWEGLTIGPRLGDDSYVMLAGTDNDYSVTQNGSNVQFDVYFNFADADPYASSIQCPLGAVATCFNTSNGQPANLAGDHRLLPGVLHAYKASADDLAGYVRPLGRCLAGDARNSSKPLRRVAEGLSDSPVLRDGETCFRCGAQARKMERRRENSHSMAIANDLPLWPSKRLMPGAAGTELERKVDVCGKALAEARHLVRRGRSDALVGQLIARASELLDDMDETLVALHPTRNAVDFAAAATLHRELEQIQAEISTLRRSLAPESSKPGWS
jgi:hypothetical protein